jgi:uncharacterized protein
MDRAGRSLGRRWRRALAAASLTMLAFVLPARADTARFFRIGTAAITSTYFVIGAELANAISKPPGSRDCAHGGSCGVEGLVAVAQGTEGAIDNVLAINSGEIEAALMQADIAFWAFTGRLPAAAPSSAEAKACRGSTGLPESGLALLRKVGPVRKLRAIAALYPEAFHLVVRQDAKVKTVGDLAGKRIALGTPNSGTLVEARLLLDAASLSECQVKAQYPRLSEAASMIESNSLDAFFEIGGYPVPAITDLASMQPIRLLPLTTRMVERLQRQYPLVSAAVIPGATYPGIDAPTPSASVPALFVVSTTVPEDLVYAITKALWQDATRRFLDNGHPAGKLIRRETATVDVGIPFHPGALRYYAEAGMEVPK